MEISMKINRNLAHTGADYTVHTYNGGEHMFYPMAQSVYTATTQVPQIQRRDSASRSSRPSASPLRTWRTLGPRSSPSGTSPCFENSVLMESKWLRRQRTALFLPQLHSSNYILINNRVTQYITPANTLVPNSLLQYFTTMDPEQRF